MDKVHRRISSKVLNNLFLLRQADQYNLGNRLQFIILNVKSVNHGLESLKYLRPRIWETIPLNLKEIDSLKNFGIQKHARVSPAKYILKT